MLSTIVELRAARGIFGKALGGGLGAFGGRMEGGGVFAGDDGGGGWAGFGGGSCGDFGGCVFAVFVDRVGALAGFCGAGGVEVLKTVG